MSVKFYEDRLNDGVTIYFIVDKPCGSSGTWSRFLQQVPSVCAVSETHTVLLSCSVHMDSRAVRVWTAKKQKLKYISGIAAMTTGQILVL